MKIAFYVLLAAIISLFTIYSCEKNNNSNILSGKLINNTGCKNSKSSNLISEIPDTLSCVNYSFDVNNNRLTIKHINAGFNCCPDSLYCEISENNDTIVIKEFEAFALCNCNCLYDLDIEINGVRLKKYQIKFVEPYSGAQEKLEFEINLNINASGSYCVTRNLYPWGMY